MDKFEVSKLLTAISTYDNRKIATETVEGWFLALGDLTYQEASEAVVMHFKLSTKWLLPGHIRYNVGMVRDQIRRDNWTKRAIVESFNYDDGFDREEHEALVRKYKREIEGKSNGEEKDK